ncbi:hypothetical protein [uncultured Phenylobacterium sp.]|uniref:hypothetical protein n=1 Tax=uncultured Phenylobacterium sp. TaxID=349273 RepID=UPI0025D0E13B|nr:hypothetical protein [uncultured Phenylobacterium sp.]
MNLSTVLPAAICGLALATFAGSAAGAAPAGGAYATRAVRAPNGKDVFVRIVKVPKMQVSAERPDCPMDPAHCAHPKADKPQAQG